MDYRMPRPGENVLSDFLKGPELRSLMGEMAELGLAVFRENAIKRSGLNARSSRSYTEIGGARMDRWTGVVLSYGPYGVSREFGSSQNSAENNLSQVRDMFGRSDVP
jgi:hypothetical protein